MINKEYNTLGIHLNRSANWKSRFCNQNCIFCMENEGGDFLRNSMPQSNSDLIEVVKYAKSSIDNLRKVIIGGGEPTLNQRLNSLITAIKKQDLKVAIVTNGTKTSGKKYLNDLINSGLDMIHVSIHGNNSVIHEYITRKEGSLRQTLLTIENALSNNLGINVNTVVCQYNFLFLSDIFGFIHDSFDGIGDHVFYHVIARGNSSNNSNVLFNDIKPLRRSLKNMIDTCSNYQISIRLRDFPLCMINYREDISRFQKFYFGRRIDGKIIISQITESERYIKGTVCNSCKYTSKCLGLLRLNYATNIEEILRDLHSHIGKLNNE